MHAAIILTVISLWQGQGSGTRLPQRPAIQPSSTSGSTNLQLPQRNQTQPPTAPATRPLTGSPTTAPTTAPPTTAPQLRPGQWAPGQSMPADNNAGANSSSRTTGAGLPPVVPASGAGSTRTLPSLSPNSTAQPSSNSTSIRLSSGPTQVPSSTGSGTLPSRQPSSLPTRTTGTTIPVQPTQGTVQPAIQANGAGNLPMRRTETTSPTLPRTQAVNQQGAVPTAVNPNISNQGIQAPPRSTHAYQAPQGTQLDPYQRPTTVGTQAPALQSRQPLTQEPAVNPLSTRISDSSNDPRVINTNPTQQPIANNELAAAPPTEISPSATEIVRRGLFGVPYGEDGLEGTPVRLIEVLPESPNAQSRLQAIQAYWQLTVTVVDHHFATEEARWLASLPLPRTTVERNQLEAMKTAAAARQRETKLAVWNSQYELSRASTRLSEGDRVLPLDAPFIGRYQTHFAQYSRARSMPAGLAKIDGALPLLLDLIAARADATESGLIMFLDASQAYRSGSVGVEQVIDAFLQSRDQRLALLATVRDYNQMIAEYALAVGPTSASRASVVAMLIEVDDAELSQYETRTDPQVRQASANGMLRQSEQRVPVQPSNRGWNSGTTYPR